MSHNNLEEAKNTLLMALRIAQDDLEVQRDDTSKYAPAGDREEILTEIDRHLDIVEEAKGIVNLWASMLKPGSCIGYKE